MSAASPIHLAECTALLSNEKPRGKALFDIDPILTRRKNARCLSSSVRFFLFLISRMTRLALFFHCVPGGEVTLSTALIDDFIETESSRTLLQAPPRSASSQNRPQPCIDLAVGIPRRERCRYFAYERISLRPTFRPSRRYEFDLLDHSRSLQGSQN